MPLKLPLLPLALTSVVAILPLISVAADNPVDLLKNNSPRHPVQAVLNAGMTEAEFRAFRDAKAGYGRLNLHAINEDRKVLDNLSPAIWYGGCAPTAAAMILMYYETLGYDIFPNNVGTTFENAENMELIASSRHFDDFYYPDDSENEEVRTVYWKTSAGDVFSEMESTTLADRSEDDYYMDLERWRYWHFQRPDCVADFLHTSFSIENNTSGSTYAASTSSRLPYWINSHVPGVTLVGENWYLIADYKPYNPNLETDPWDVYVNEIDSGRPAYLSVDATGDGVTDHGVAGVGYEVVDGERYFACLNTWVSEVMWYQWGATGELLQEFAVSSVNAMHFTREPVSAAIFSPNYLYRFYRPASGAYFFSANPEEVAAVENNLDHEWKFQGPVFEVETVSTENNRPVYRFYNAKAAAHFYTISEAERDNVIANLSDNFSYEGVAFYAHPTYQKGDNYVYRFYLPKTSSHFFTNSYEEAMYLHTHGIRNTSDTRVWRGLLRM